MRHQAHEGPIVTNLRHERVQLSDLERFTLRLLDGSLDRGAVAARVEDAMRRRQLVLSRDGVEIEGDEVAVLAERATAAALDRAAASALLSS